MSRPANFLGWWLGAVAGGLSAYGLMLAYRCSAGHTTPVVNVPVEANVDKLHKFVHPPAGVRPRFQPLARKPETAHLVNFVEMKRPTGLPTEAFNFRHTRAGALAFVAYVKDVLLRAHRSDEDARIIARRWAHETENARDCFGENWANVKSTGATYGDEHLVLEQHQLWCSVPEANGVWIANGSQEIPGKVDGYLAYTDSAAYARHEYRLLNSTRYQGVLAGHRRGGLEGGVQAERELGTTSTRPGWSYASPTEREAQFRAYWTAMRALVGADAWEGLR